MPSTYRVKITSIASDGTNLFLEIEITNGATTQPTIRPTFQVGTTPAEITAYIQQIADNRPTLASEISDLVGTSVIGA